MFHLVKKLHYSLMLLLKMISNELSKYLLLVVYI